MCVWLSLGRWTMPKFNIKAPRNPSWHLHLGLSLRVDSHQLRATGSDHCHTLVFGMYYPVDHISRSHCAGNIPLPRHFDTRHSSHFLHRHFSHTEYESYPDTFTSPSLLGSQPLCVSLPGSRYPLFSSVPPPFPSLQCAGNGLWPYTCVWMPLSMSWSRRHCAIIF